MSEETAVVTEEVVDLENTQEENAEGKSNKKRGRKSAPKKNYKRVFTKSDDCDANPPLDEKDMPVEGYRAYTIEFKDDITFTKGQKLFVHGRSADQACSFIVSHYVEASPTHEQQRGPSRKIDENFLKYCHLMHSSGMNDGLQQFFAEYPHYEKIDFTKPVEELIQEYVKK